MAKRRVLQITGITEHVGTSLIPLVLQVAGEDVCVPAVLFAVEMSFNDLLSSVVSIRIAEQEYKKV
jgi:hypothetical protein